jgi:hypothetical protein
VSRRQFRVVVEDLLLPAQVYLGESEDNACEGDSGSTASGHGEGSGSWSGHCKYAVTN